ncbi:ADP-heptose:LPS heptosyltransferase [Thioflavicoccus mobilis 8321]|uniref:ADP-heptose:LPS heptosyltransferase n=1 Tax=Thioflavicoccus mobilis 8321 TaxID=765912 RepID=L0GZH0_9GAMM|nr:glycosyltransferase family 9 protein [Thioflavicoccus mobilis]AGA90709.1 ADP-heptose:LPS heptosyltransferase [Thioflavicoccus mobilis 8321]
MKILLVRLSAIGDVLFATPLIDALRRAHANAEIVWLAQPECAPLIEGHPGLDAVLVWPRREWLALWRARRFAALIGEFAAFRRRLRAEHFDLAIDLQGLLKSGLLAWLSGAPQRVGLGSREGSQWLMTRTIPRGGDARRIGSEYRHLAATLGLPSEEFSMALHLARADEAFAEAQVRKYALGDGYAVLCPFTTRPQKHWLESRWAELADRLAGELGLRSVLLGGPGDRAAAKRIRTATRSDLVSLVGETSLREAAAVIAGARLLVGVDTGLGHMGIALRRPSLLLFGSTRPYLDTGRPDAQVLYHALDCSPCRRDPTCEGRFTCMRLIAVDECLAAARELLGRSAG